MVHEKRLSNTLFIASNYTFFVLLAFLCLFPMIHVLAVSLSSNAPASAGMVKFWPVKFTLQSYQYVLHQGQFWISLGISVKRVILGTVVNMLMTISIAYPLSKETQSFRWRTVYAWYFVLTILFSGGLVPLYMTVLKTGLMDTIWALILPGAVPVFSIILLLNFFRGLPKGLEESASIDGAGHWTILWKIYVPLSTPALATICLLTMVGHWNAWFDGLIFMNSPSHYPLQTYLQTIIISGNFNPATNPDLRSWILVSDQTIKSSQIFLGTLPILIVYPFLQKYFIKGIVLGSIKE